MSNATQLFWLSIALYGIVDSLFVRSSPYGERYSFLNVLIYSFIYRVCHFFFKMLFTTRTVETSLSVDVYTLTSHTCEERPLWMIVPTARTVSPSCAEETWLPLTCMPTTISSGFAKMIEPMPATVSAKAKVAPPCRMPNG